MQSGKNARSAALTSDEVGPRGEKSVCILATAGLSVLLITGGGVVGCYPGRQSNAAWIELGALHLDSKLFECFLDLRAFCELLAPKRNPIIRKNSDDGICLASLLHV